MRTVLTTGGRPASTGPDIEAPDIEASLLELTGLVREMRCAAMASLMRQDVSLPQLHVLWLLEHHGELSMTRLAEHLGVSLSTATGLMDRMEERGLIERTRVPDDRRRVNVRPGAAGRLALEQTEGLRRDRLRAILTRLDAGQLRRLTRAVRDVRSAGAAAMAETAGARSAGDGRDSTRIATAATPHRHYFTDDPA